MRMHTHGHYTTVQKPAKQPAFEPIFYNTFLYLLTNLCIHQCNCCVLTSFLQAGEGNQQSKQLLSLFLL